MIFHQVTRQRLAAVVMYKWLREILTWLLYSFLAETPEMELPSTQRTSGACNWAFPIDVCCRDAAVRVVSLAVIPAFRTRCAKAIEVAHEVSRLSQSE